MSTDPRPAGPAPRLGTHGESYGNWMSAPVLWLVGGLAILAALLAVFCFALFARPVPGGLLTGAALVLGGILGWLLWIRRQYAFTGGGIMAQVHREVLDHLDFPGQGTVLEVGCGSGALAIRAALTWPEAQVTGVDLWSPVYRYSQELCERNAASEGVAGRCRFQPGDANHLDFPDESFDAVVSNYVYHNISGADHQDLLRETLRVLKKGGVFALNDEMKPQLYGDMEAFAQSLREAGYETVTLLDTAQTVFGSRRRAARMLLGDSRLLVGRK